MKADAGPDRKGRKSRSSEPRKKLTFSQQREYETIEDVIDELTAKSEKLSEEMLQATTDYVRLQELTEEKQKTDDELEEKIARFIELQELVESFNA
jgi:ATP-binding cassette subfamily F protein uup